MALSDCVERPRFRALVVVVTVLLMSGLLACGGTSDSDTTQNDVTASSGVSSAGKLGGGEDIEGKKKRDGRAAHRTRDARGPGGAGRPRNRSGDRAVAADQMPIVPRVVTNEGMRSCSVMRPLST